MEPMPARMHSKIARRKVQVVYYLHRRGGHIEHPHLLEGFLLPAQDGLRLKDFKNWLSALRGKGMPDSFSWSYKRSYKAGFIWQDLSGDDLIHPLQKNEYVLMGFELQSQGPQSCKCGQYAPEVCVESAKIGRRQSSKEEFKLHELLKEGIMEYIHVSPSEDSPKKTIPGIANGTKNDSIEHVISACPSFKAENLQTSLTGFSDCDDCQPYEVESPMSTKQATAVHVASEMTTISAPLLRKQGSGEVKVYKAKEAEQTTDAATQTGESKRCSTEEALNTSFNSAHPQLVQNHLATSLLLMNNHHRATLRSSSLPLFTPADNHFQNMGHDLLLKGSSHTTTSHGVNDTEQDSYTNGHNNSMLSVSATASNKSEMFYSPSSVHSSCTVLETVSPGSARSLRSVNSVNSTRFSTTVDDQFLSSNVASNNAGASPLTKAKLSSSTHLLKQLLSCGSVDISDSSMLNLKAMSLRNAPTSTPSSISNAEMPTGISHERYLHKKSQSPHLLHQQCEDVSPPTTPKSWLCRPCGGHNSCFTPLEVHSSPHHIPNPLSREGSLKEIDAFVVANGSPDSVSSKKSPPLLPPLLNLNYSLSSKTRSVGDAMHKKSIQVGLNRDPVVVRRSVSGGSRDLSSATNWTHTTAHNSDRADPLVKKGAAGQELSTDASTPHKASIAINKKMINSLLRRSLPAQPTSSRPAGVVMSPPRSCYSSDSQTAVACSPSDQDSCQRQLHYFTDIKCRPAEHQQATSLYELVKNGPKRAADIMS